MKYKWGLIKVVMYLWCGINIDVLPFLDSGQLGQPVSNLRKACSKTITDAGIDEDEALKILTTIMWASTANEVSAAFWTMSEALTRPDVIEELRSYILNHPEAESDLFLRSVVWEAIRVHSNPNSFRCDLKLLIMLR